MSGERVGSRGPEEHAPASHKEALEQFEGQRSLLLSIAYRMLGSVTEAEDAVQEAYLRYQATPPERIRSARAFLCTVVTRLCLDQLKSARARRECYVGPWLPEPLLTTDGDPWLTPGHRVETYESISMAFLVLLESLTPVERAVFLLREVFEFGYPEIAAIIGRREDACRQVFHRAKQAIAERRPRFTSRPEDSRRLTRSFVRAIEAGDLAGLTRLLAEDITLWSDGGGKVAAALRPLHGAGAVARFLLGVSKKALAGTGYTHEVTEVNGEPALLIRVGGEPRLTVVVIETDGRLIRNLRIVGNPDKLAHLQYRRPPRASRHGGAARQPRGG